MIKVYLFSAMVSFVFALTPIPPAHATELGPDKNTSLKIFEKVSKKRIQELHQHAKRNGYSTRYGIFANLQLNSGKKRFYLVDLENNTLQEEALVTHGHCKEEQEGVRFSNVAESNCSSEGKYSIGKSYYGIFGLAYKLHGLDKTNSNAFARHIVLHAHECVYDQTWPTEICESEGCPTVSPKVLQKLKSIIETETKPIILWIYKDPSNTSNIVH